MGREGVDQKVKDGMSHDGTYTQLLEKITLAVTFGSLLRDWANHGDRSLTFGAGRGVWKLPPQQFGKRQYDSNTVTRSVPTVLPGAFLSSS
jgi:hypothetical protein